MKRKKKTKPHRKLLSGSVLLGFAEVFDESFGDPKTPKPYLLVTPSAVGRILLPFPCPRCNEASCDSVDPRTRDKFRDAERGFSWCPKCSYRFVLDLRGAPLASTLEPGAQSAPPRIGYRSLFEPLRAPDDDGLLLMGAD